MIKSSFFLCLLITIFTSPSLRAQTPSVKWSYNLRDVSFGQTAAADIDGDGKLELVFSTYWNDSNVYVLNAENGTLKWKHNLGGCNDAGPLIYDVDGDGDYEIIVASSCNPVTTCFDADSGFIQWQAATGGSDSPPTIADIDGDGQLEILQGQFNGHVLSLNAKTGAVKWDLVVDANAAIESEPAILDADGDGHPDFIVSTWSYSGANRILCYRGVNHTLLWQSALPKDLIYHGAAFGDIDRDGKPEITVGDYAGDLFCLNAENGSPLWIDSIPGFYNYIGAPTTLADLDRDHYLDVIYCDAYHVGAVKHDGSPLWTYTIPNYGTAFRGVAVADVNNDNTLDITFATSEGTVTSLDGMTGAVIRSMDLRAVYNDTFEIDNAPIIADFDGDGIRDVFIVGGKARYPDIQGNYGRAYCLSWGVGKGPDWKMFRHDERRSGCLCDAAGLPLPPLDMPDINKTNLSQLVVFPNPASGDFYVSFSLEKPQALTLSILDMQGKKALPDIVRSYREGISTEAFGKGKGNALPAGSYLVQLSSESQKLTQRVEVLR